MIIRNGREPSVDAQDISTGLPPLPARGAARATSEEIWSRYLEEKAPRLEARRTAADAQRLVIRVSFRKIVTPASSAPKGRVRHFPWIVFRKVLRLRKSPVYGIFRYP